jgi:cytochrome c biogenesis protein CcmG/thiol:disulfide interchange protein DsbE
VTIPGENGDEAGPVKKGGGPRRARLIVAGLVLFTGFASVAIWQAVSSSSSTGSGVLVGSRGQPAPPFSLPVLQDPQARVSLASLRGKPLVVNFWASWCIPCRTEMPLLEAAFRAEHKNVEFLGIDANDTPSAALAFLAQMHVTYPTVSDSNGATALRYGLYGLPITVFISPIGKILGRHVGQLRPSTLRAALQQAFPHA